MTDADRDIQRHVTKFVFPESTAKCIDNSMGNLDRTFDIGVWHQQAELISTVAGCNINRAAVVLDHLSGHA